MSKCQHCGSPYCNGNCRIGGPTELPLGDAPPKRKKGGLSKGATLVLFAVIATAVGVTFVARIGSQMSSRRVWLVNGLGVEYDITIDGERHTVKRRPIPIEIGEGTFEVVSVTPGIEIRETVEIDPPLLSRFTGYTYVLNPDRAAILSWEETTYAERESDRAFESRLHGGDLVHEFKGIEHEFEEFPDEIYTSSQRESRQRVGMFDDRDVDLGSLAYYLDMELGSETALALVKRRVTFEPDRPGNVQALAGLMPPDDFIDMARQHLDSRPARIEWHRTYQDHVRNSMEPNELIPEYEALLETDPGDGTLLYLLGRIHTDVDRAEDLLLRATRADPPSPDAYRGLAFDRLITGRFDNAAESIAKALELAPNERHAPLHELREEIHNAAGRYDELLAEAQRRQRIDPLDYGAVDDTIYYLGRLGQSGPAERELNQYSRLMREDGYTSDEIADDAKWLRVTLLVAAEDVDGFVAFALKHPDLEYLSDRDLLLGDTSAAATRLDAFDYPTLSERFLVYAMAAVEGSHELAEVELAKSVLLAKESGDVDWERVASWLESGSPPDDDTVRGLKMMPSVKRVALIALGAAFPSHRDRFWDLAEQLNYERRWPYFSVRHVLENG